MPLLRRAAGADSYSLVMKATSEAQAAKQLIAVLVDCYEVDPPADRDVWAEYRRVMVREWQLTQAQANVAVLCCQGYQNREIAAKLGVSLETTNKHMDVILRKLNVHTRTGVATRLLERTSR